MTSKSWGSSKLILSTSPWSRFNSLLDESRADLIEAGAEVSEGEEAVVNVDNRPQAPQLGGTWVVAVAEEEENGVVAKHKASLIKAPLGRLKNILYH